MSSGTTKYQTDLDDQGNVAEEFDPGFGEVPDPGCPHGSEGPDDEPQGERQGERGDRQGDRPARAAQEVEPPGVFGKETGFQK